jgi:signal transduction histidine kinase
MNELLAHSSAPAAPDRRGGGPAVAPIVVAVIGAIGMALGAPWLGLLLSGLALLRRAMAESDAGGGAAALAALAAVGVILGGGDPAWAAALPPAATIAPRRPDAPAAAACGGALAALTVAWSPHATAALPPAVLGGMLIGAAAHAGARAGAAAFTGSWTLAAWGAGDATLAAITTAAALLWRPPRAPTGARRMPGRRPLAALAILGAALLPDGATFPAMALPALIALPALLALLTPAPAASAASPPAPPAPAASPAPPPDALDLALRTVIHDLQHTRRTMRSGADPTAALELVDRLIAGLTRYLSDRQITAPPVIVDARAALHAAAAAWTPVAQRHGIALRVRPPRAGAPLLIRADPTAVRRILDNLIDNAVRATPPGGRIELAASVAGAMALLTVSDTGCGIPPHLRDAVFRPAVTTRPDGQGLGLAIVRDLAAAMHGDVILHDRPGGGVCIGVRLPCAVAGRESVTTEATTDRRAW